MFDANMRYLPEGKIFFCKLHSCTKESPLAAIGCQRDSIVLCQMLDEENDYPRVKFFHQGKTVVMECQYRKYHTFAVYEGNYDGTGFINEESRTIAMQIKEQGDE